MDGRISINTVNHTKKVFINKIYRCNEYAIITPEEKSIKYTIFFLKKIQERFPETAANVVDVSEKD